MKTVYITPKVACSGENEGNIDFYEIKKNTLTPQLNFVPAGVRTEWRKLPQHSCLEIGPQSRSMRRDNQ